MATTKTRSTPRYTVTFTAPHEVLTAPVRDRLTREGFTVEPVAVRYAERWQTAESLVEGAASVVEELASEMHEWHDNMPENLQDGDKGSEVEECASALDELQSEAESIRWMGPEAVFAGVTDDAMPTQCRVSGQREAGTIGAATKRAHADFDGLAVVGTLTVVKVERGAPSRADRLAEASTAVQEALALLEDIVHDLEESLKPGHTIGALEAITAAIERVNACIAEVDDLDFDNIDFPGMY